MERELWRLLYYLVKQQDVGWGSWRYSTADIVVVYLWAVVHDRPTAWAACPENWPPDLCPQPLPTQGTLSRRLRKPSCVLLLNLGQGIVKKIDGKALAVSLVSKDPDAGYGRGAGGKQLGYKLHVIWGGGPMVDRRAAGRRLPADGHRVRHWVQAKLLIAGIRSLPKQPLLLLAYSRSSTGGEAGTRYTPRTDVAGLA